MLYCCMLVMIVVKQARMFTLSILVYGAGLGILYTYIYITLISREIMRT